MATAITGRTTQYCRVPNLAYLMSISGILVSYATLEIDDPWEELPMDTYNSSETDMACQEVTLHM